MKASETLNKIAANLPEGDLDMLSLMQGLGVANPEVLQLAQLLQNSEQNEGSCDAEDDTRKESDHIRDDLIEQNAWLMETNQWLSERVAMFARAVGACPACLGEDRVCKACGGKGSPGKYKPDRILFEELIMPVIGRLNAQIRLRHRARQSAERNHNNGQPVTSTSNKGD